MSLDSLKRDFAQAVSRHVHANGMHGSEIPGVFFIRSTEITTPIYVLHQPAICLVAQGRKQVLLGEDIYEYGTDRCLIVSVGMAVTGNVIEASPEAPYLCLRLDLDPGDITALMMDAKIETRAPAKLGPGISLGEIQEPVLNAVIRLVNLLDSPQDIPVLAPIIIREILYRLLVGEESGRLRQIAHGDPRLESINRAIQWLKANYAAPFHIDDLAREASMSPSALHHHFKTVTAMSPLQFQKQLRLQEARRLMLSQSMDASSASLQVGYESPSQFSREYSRLFGAPPLRDINRLKTLPRPEVAAVVSL